MGSAIRIGRAGASESKKLASWNCWLGALSTSGSNGPQHSQWTYTQRSWNHPESAGVLVIASRSWTANGMGGAAGVWASASTAANTSCTSRSTLLAAVSTVVSVEVMSGMTSTSVLSTAGAVAVSSDV